MFINLMIKCRGFIVNIHDTVNYDIDFEQNVYEKYWNVLTNPYFYSDFEYNQTSHTIKTANIPSQEVASIAYRCRLKGVGVRDNADASLLKEAYVELCRKIDSWEGWVECTLYDVDSFSRILIELRNPENHKENLLDFFFTPRYEKVFYVYH